MDYELSTMEKLFSFFGYAILDIDRFKSLAFSYQRERLYNDALKTSGKALLKSLHEVMELREQFPPELDTKLSQIYNETNNVLDLLTIELIRIQQIYGPLFMKDGDKNDIDVV